MSVIRELNCPGDASVKKKRKKKKKAEEPDS